MNIRTLYLCALAALLLPLPAHAVGMGIMEGNEVRSDNLKPFPKWTGVLDRYFDQKAQFRNSQCGQNKFNPCSLRDWREFLGSIKNKPLKTQVEQVHRYANAHRYIVDPVNWGVKDYWATPYEFTAKDGDCEDYAIAKFVSLRALGVPNDSMRIVILQDMNLGGIMHAVLAVNVNGDPMILDNQLQSVISARKIYHYKPIYSINETSWWLHRR